MVIHEKYKPLTMDNDICMIMTDEAFDLSGDNVQEAVLARELPQAGERGLFRSLVLRTCSNANY